MANIEAACERSDVLAFGTQKRRSTTPPGGSIATGMLCSDLPHESSGPAGCGRGFGAGDIACRLDGPHESFDGRASFSTWLCGILRRKIADYYRAVSRERALADVETSDGCGPLFSKRGKWLETVAPWRESPEQLAENLEFWEVMANCLANLPAHFVEAFQMREIRLASVEEVCKSTGVTPRHLSVRLHRAQALAATLPGSEMVWKQLIEQAQSE